jgi:hypothetical protein
VRLVVCSICSGRGVPRDYDIVSLIVCTFCFTSLAVVLRNPCFIPVLAGIFLFVERLLAERRR